jgi:hypothetical protein
VSNSFALTSVRIIAERRSQLQPSVRARSKLRNTTGPDAPNEPRRTAFLMLGTNSRAREAQARCLPRRSAGNCISGIPKLIELPIVVSRCLDRSQYLYALLGGAARHHREAAKRREEDRHIEASDDSRSANEHIIAALFHAAVAEAIEHGKAARRTLSSLGAGSQTRLTSMS